MSKARDLANAGTALTTVSATELGYLDGVTSAIQTQINAKQAVVAGVNDTEIGYLDGVTSAIQTQINAQIPKSIVDAKGDIIAATAADTVARLAVGSNDQVLTADSSTATGLKWATPSSGGMTLINTGGTTLTGSSVTIGSIPGTYKNLQIVMRNYKPSADGYNLGVRLNNNSTASTYRDFNPTQWNGFEGGFNTTSWDFGGAQDNGNDDGFSLMEIFDYTNTTTWKFARSFSAANHETNTSNIRYYEIRHFFKSFTAITEINFFAYSGTFTSGTVYVYGVK